MQVTLIGLIGADATHRAFGATHDRLSHSTAQQIVIISLIGSLLLEVSRITRPEPSQQTLVYLRQVRLLELFQTFVEPAQCNDAGHGILVSQLCCDLCLGAGPYLEVFIAANDIGSLEGS